MKGRSTQRPIIVRLALVTRQDEKKVLRRTTTKGGGGFGAGGHEIEVDLIHPIIVNMSFRRESEAKEQRRLPSPIKLRGTRIKCAIAYEGIILKKISIKRNPTDPRPWFVCDYRGHPRIIMSGRAAYHNVPTADMQDSNIRGC